MIELAEETAKDILGSIQIPPQPELLINVQRELDKQYPDQNQLSEFISRDVGLSAAILRIINSPYYGMRSEINTVHHAISLLGMTHVSNLLATILFRMAMETDGFTPMPRYWDNAEDIARLSGYLARQLGIVTADQAYTVGLFYDCGIPVMAQQYDDYKETLAQQNQQELSSFMELEDQHYSTNHATIGYFVTRSWGLPQVLREACLLHHDIEYVRSQDARADPTCKNLIMILKIAEHIANTHRNDADYEWRRFKPHVLEHLGMSEPDYVDLRADLFEVLNGSAS